MKRYFQENPEKYLFHAAKKRAELSGIEFNILEEDIVIPDTCPVLGVKLSPVRSGDKTYAPSLDRKDNNKGYVVGNVFVISWLANKYKSNMSRDVIKGLYNYVST